MGRSRRWPGGDAQGATRRLFRQGSDCIKIWVTGAVKAAMEAGITTVEHGFEFDEECLRLLKQHDTIVVATLWLCVQWYTTYDAPYRPVQDQFPGDTPAERELAKIWANIRDVHRAGIRIAVGSDSFSSELMPFGASTLKEISVLVEYGELTPMEAIESATRISSHAIGLEDLVGTLEAGKAADFVALDADPLADIDHLVRNHMRLIVKDGVAHVDDVG